MIFNDDNTFLRNKPLISTNQVKSNLINNATNMLSISNKTSINITTNQERLLQPYKPPLERAYNETNIFKPTMNFQYDSNPYNSKQPQKKQDIEPIDAIQNRMQKNFSTNKFSYLHEKYQDNYITQNLTQPQQKYQSPSLIGFNQGGNQINQRPILEKHQKNVLSSQGMNVLGPRQIFNTANTMTEQRYKLDSELSLYKRKPIEETSFKEKEENIISTLQRVGNQASMPNFIYKEPIREQQLKPQQSVPRFQPLQKISTKLEDSYEKVLPFDILD